MSTDLKTNMKHHIATEFYGGIERGRCIQITSRNQNGWIQLTGSEAMDLVDTLLEFVADVMEGKLQESCRRREDRATEASHQASVLANVCADQKREIERLREALGHLDAAAHVSRENQGGWLGAPFVEQIVRAALAKEDKPNG
jgi:hypothetical protein